MNMVFKRAKILAGVGPATNSQEKIEQMLLAGVNGYRMNFSHGNYEEREQQLTWIREASEKHKKPVAVVQDLQGPKIRLGEIIDNHYDVKAGDEIQLVYGVKHEGSTLPVQYDLSQKVKVGERVYMFDGKIQSRATAVDTEARKITVKIENDGYVMSRKGLNVPDTDFGGDIITQKDYEDIDWAAERDFDYVALSFIQTAHDIEVLRGYLASKGSTAQVIAKVETKAAIAPGELERIVEASDGVMVARGDLAIEVGVELVPTVQREIIRLCQKHAKLSIVATQMMGSMVDNPSPTRAEVSDVSTAVILGADCLMLSDETANGKYPIETIASMKKVIKYTQENILVNSLAKPELPDSLASAISAAAVSLADEIGAEALVAETKSGATAHYVAAQRPSRPIISVTSDKRVAQQLALLYANKSFLRPDGKSIGLELAQELAQQDYLHKGSSVVVVSGRQPGMIGGTDTIKVRRLE